MLAKYSYDEARSSSVISEDIETEKLDEISKQMKVGLLNNSSVNAGGSMVSSTREVKPSN